MNSAVIGFIAPKAGATLSESVLARAVLARATRLRLAGASCAGSAAFLLWTSRMIAIHRSQGVLRVAMLLASGVVACATPPSHQPPQQPQLAQATGVPPRLRPPEQLPETARVLLRGRMASHANDMSALMSAIMVLDYPRIGDRAEAIAADERFARPLTGDATELASALPEKFFLYQDNLRLEAKTLADAAGRAHAFDVADSYGRLSQVCVR